MDQGYKFSPWHMCLTPVNPNNQKNWNSTKSNLDMIMAVKEDCGKIGGPQECAGCGKKIHDKYLLKVISQSVSGIKY